MNNRQLISFFLAIFIAFSLEAADSATERDEGIEIPQPKRSPRKRHNITTCKHGCGMVKGKSKDPSLNKKLSADFFNHERVLCPRLQMIRCDECSAELSKEVFSKGKFRLEEQRKTRRHKGYVARFNPYDVLALKSADDEILAFGRAEMDTVTMPVETPLFPMGDATNQIALLFPEVSFPGAESFSTAKPIDDSLPSAVFEEKITRTSRAKKRAKSSSDDAPLEKGEDESRRPFCDSCQKSFKSKKLYERHLKTKLHSDTQRRREIFFTLLYAPELLAPRIAEAQKSDKRYCMLCDTETKGSPGSMDDHTKSQKHQRMARSLGIDVTSFDSIIEISK